MTSSTGECGVGMGAGTGALPAIQHVAADWLEGWVWVGRTNEGW